MSEASNKREGLIKIKELIAAKKNSEAKNIAEIFKANKKFSTIDELTFYGNILLEIGDLIAADEYITAAINKARPNKFTNELETLYWNWRVQPALRSVRSGIALAYVMSLDEITTVLDVGSGGGEHALHFANAGRLVDCVDFGTSIYVTESKALDDADVHPSITKAICDFTDFDSDKKYDLVWCSHVLEHQRNPNQFLKKCISHLQEDGWLAITVPPLKHNIVGGHLTLWNAGLLVYNLIHAGIDCSNAVVMNYGYNISIIVKKREIELPNLDWDSGDIDRLKAFFPKNCCENFDGQMLGYSILSEEAMRLKLEA